MPESLRRGLLILPPLLLAALETLHPQPEPTVQAMLDVATWFAIFHVIQLVLIGFVALSFSSWRTPSDARTPEKTRPKEFPMSALIRILEKIATAYGSAVGCTAAWP